MHTEYLDPYTLSWPDGVFPLGSDALALGDFATLRRGSTLSAVVRGFAEHVKSLREENGQAD